MNQYFDQENHITQAGIQALVQEDASEAERLMLSEHLSVCDECLLRYTRALSPEKLKEPSQPLLGKILRQVRLRLAARTVNRYVTAGIAACAAIALWIGGAFTPEVLLGDASYAEDLKNVSTVVSEKTKQITTSLSDVISQIIYAGGRYHEKK